MIGTLLAAGLVVVGAGSVLSFGRRTFKAGLSVQALGIAVVGLAGLAVFATGDDLGASFTSELAPRLGVDPTSGYPVRPRAGRSAGGRLRHPLPRPGRADARQAG